VQSIVISDHDLIYCDVKFQRPNLPMRSVKLRNLLNVDIELVICELVKNMQFVSTNDANQYMSSIISAILGTFNTIAPIYNNTFVVYPTAVHISEETKNLIKSRDEYKKRSDKSPNDLALKEAVKILRNKVKKCIIADTKSDLDRRIHLEGKRNRSLWSTIKKFMNTETRLPSGNNWSTDIISEHFASVSRKTPDHPPTAALTSNINDGMFRFLHITAENIIKSWTTLKKLNSSSTDPNGISAHMLDICLQSNIFVSYLKDCFNSCLNSNIFPDCIKITPVPKIPNHKSTNDLRPISIQSNIAKLFEKCLFYQLSKFMERTNIFAPSQFGFRSNHSPCPVIIKLTDFIG
jgi:hypothetical protein